MTGDDVLLESRTMRAALAGRIEALERVKPLSGLTLPNGLHLLTEAVADYFAVPIRAVHSLVLDHREELVAYGYQVLTGPRLTAFKNASGIQSRARQLALFNRRTVLCAAMLLRESDIARQVRSRLLDLEAGARFLPVDNPLRPQPGGPDPDPVEVASTALRAVIGSTVVPLLNALLEQAGTQEVTLGEVRCRLEQLELMIVDEDGSAPLPRRFHLVHGVEPADPGDGDQS